jgi:hypothetical protein
LNSNLDHVDRLDHACGDHSGDATVDKWQSSANDGGVKKVICNGNTVTFGGVHDF